MKAVLIIAALTFSGAFAHAESLIETGIECTMEYSNSNMFSTNKLSTSGRLTEDSMLVGTAVATDGDGAGTGPANYILVSKTKENGAPFWKIKVNGSEKNLLGTGSFPVTDPMTDLSEVGMTVIVPVKALDIDSEDPATFDTLKVTCVNTIFAG